MRLVFAPDALVPVAWHGCGVVLATCVVQQDTQAVLLVPLPLADVDPSVAVEQHPVAMLLVLLPLAAVLLVRLVGSCGVLVRAEAVSLFTTLADHATPSVHVAVRKVHRHSPLVELPLTDPGSVALEVPAAAATGAGRCTG
eukprot:CAMPEP_0183449284 /NCGR_PEP_ID=MMETSP0370-20130417/109105_1 /TAXON_ID=268820 /ORGANISM="Peridinium aciculiferum, Strain PAER-2" /LENGTH=140 /DNA_ID=CAMNT_0025640355 /DNA_START=6 /DNA_END=425 /DNA_ORIENTATION=-